MNKKNQINKKAKTIATRLCGLPLADAMMILNQAEHIVLSASTKTNTRQRKKPVIAQRPRSFLGRNSEITAYIDMFLGKYTYKQILGVCEEKFGKHKGLSRSEIGRYGRKRFLEVI